MKWIRLIPILVFLALSVPASGSGQEVVWTRRPGSEGWIGFWYTYSKAPVDGRDQTVVVVTEVAENSPAEASGIAAGDIITHLDGQPISQELFSSMSHALEPGDLVRIVVRRDGRPREFTVEAASPPAQVIFSPHADRIVLELEALSGNILKSMDSLRVSLGGLRVNDPEGSVSFQVLRIPSDSSGNQGSLRSGFTLGQPFGERLVFGSEGSFLEPDMALPFEAMVFQSPATAPLRVELAGIRKELTSVRRDELTRRRELGASVQGNIEEVLRRDERMKELQAKEVELLSKQEEMEARLRDLSEAELQRHWVDVQSRSEGAFISALRAQEEASARARSLERGQREEQLRTQYEITYRSPVIMGQDFFMGAQMAPLSPALAQYVQVDKGVFVVQVVEESPASEAGLQGGDVIVAVAGEEVSSLSDLRFNLSAVEGPIQIQLIRKGSPVRIVIRR